MSDEVEQSRLQEYTDLGAPPVETRPPVCERCGDDLADTDTTRDPNSRAEYMAGVLDIRASNNDPRLCEDCQDLDQYLTVRYQQLTERAGVVGAVAVFCSCHDADEVDVRPVRRGDTLNDVACVRCESQEVVVEELPPSSTPGHLEVDQ
jgi:hypothetical protein